MESEREEDVDKTTRFVNLLTSHQPQLFAYINTLMFAGSSAQDVLQDTNLRLWAHLEDYDAGRPFLPWAFGFAYQSVLAFRKKTKRSKLLFSDQIIHEMSDAFLEMQSQSDDRVAALQDCIERLGPASRQLIRRRYVGQESVTALASQLGMGVNQLSARLYRIRNALAKCIEATVMGDLRQ